MAAPTAKIFVVGLNSARYYLLGTYGVPAASSPTTAYDGVLIGGPVTFTYEPPDPTSILHPGNNTVLQRDVLPAQDTSSGSLEVSRTDYAALAALSNVKVRTIGNVNALLWQTNQQGEEPTVALVLYQQGKLQDGTRVWSTYVFPKSVIVPKPKGMSREQSNLKYFVQPQTCTAYLTGEAFTSADDGATMAEMIELQSFYRLHFASWKANGSTAAFSYAASLQGANAVPISVVKVSSAGVVTEAVAGATADKDHYTAATTGVTFGANVDANDIITVMYELADDAVDSD